MLPKSGRQNCHSTVSGFPVVKSLFKSIPPGAQRTVPYVQSIFREIILGFLQYCKPRKTSKGAENFAMKRCVFQAHAWAD